MAENYISQAYTWVTGNTITAARLNSNISALISGLSDGTKAVNINKLLIGAQAVFTLSSTDINVTNLNTVSMKNDLTIYKPTNDGNPKIVLGASATESLFITAEYGSGTQTLQKATFNTKTASATADYGQFVFSVDEVEVINFKDALVTITGGLNMSGDLNINTNKFNVTASSGNTLIAGTLGVTGSITGNLTGNCSGSSGSCTGNAATASAVAASALTGNTLASGVTASSLTSVGILTGLTINGTLALGANSITMTGSIGTTGSRITKLWATDITCTNNISAGLTGNVTGNCSGSSGSCTGNSATATALATPRAINGVNFDGTAAITVTADANTLTGTTLKSTITASSLTSVGTLTGLTVNGTSQLSASVYSVAKTSYFSSSTKSGWTSTSGSITYFRVGNIVYVWFSISGTSNATTATFTLPYACNNSTDAACVVTDNGTTQTTPGKVRMVGTSTVNIYKDFNENPFTSSGTKTVSGYFWYYTEDAL